MDTNDIKTKYNNLKSELRDVLSRMERSDKIFIIRNEIKTLQELCPHNNGAYDFSNNNECPYCGKKFKE